MCVLHGGQRLSDTGLHFTVFQTGFLTGIWSVPIWLNWLVSKSLGSAYACVLRAGEHCGTWIFTFVPGDLNSGSQTRVPIILPTEPCPLPPPSLLTAQMKGLYTSNQAPHIPVLREHLAWGRSALVQALKEHKVDFQNTLGGCVELG